MKAMFNSLSTFAKGLMALLVVVSIAACSNQADQSGTAKQPDKSDLKILYVGTNPDKPLSDREKDRSFDLARDEQFRKTRAPDFEGFLKQYFDTVNVVYGDDYREAMSADYDVTIIDTYLPRPADYGMKTDPETGKQTFSRGTYLSKEDDHATMMIGEPSAYVGESRQLKIDHLCLCLDAHALGMKLDHPIFNSPYKVDITYEEREVLSNYKARYTGRDLGDTMPMWRIQTEGYRDGKGFPIGLVSGGHQFDNGVDAEWISSGTCDKGVEATAIGRHANFLHWGFAAAPEYMTDSAKLAFINAVHYIAPFKGEKQIVRKIKGTFLREDARERQWMVTDRGWAAWKVKLDESRQKSREGRKKLQAKKEAGETLSEFESMILNMPIQDETRAWTVRHEEQELKDKFGENWAAYEQYYVENMDYFYAIDERYSKAVDEDAKSLGIPNSSVKLLDKAVEMLKTGDRTDMAKRILGRYTNESFQTADEWAAWLSANSDKLYFSEGDGYKFIVVPK